MRNVTLGAILFVMIVGTLLVVQSLLKETRQIIAITDNRQVELAQVRGEQSNLQRSISEQSTAAYIIARAREYGYIKKGEILFVVANPEALYDENLQDIVVESAMITEDNTP